MSEAPSRDTYPLTPGDLGEAIVQDRPGVRSLHIAALLALIAFLTYANFTQVPVNANAESRLALSLSIARRGQLTVDQYARYTVDKAFVHGHYYSDKAPGLSFIAVPIVGALGLLPNRRGVVPDSASESNPWSAAYGRLAYVATLTSSSFIVALAVGAVFLVALRLCGSHRGAACVAVAYGFATPTFGWSTTFIGHAPAGALLLLGFACLQTLEHDVSSWHSIRTIVAGTAVLAWAVVTEFTAAPAVLIILIFQARRIRLFAAEWRRPVAVALLTALVCAAPLLLYNWVAFGAPWRLGYESVQGFPGMQQGLFGIRVPSLHVLREITIGEHRGIVPLCPLLVLVPVALWYMSRTSDRALAATLAVIIAYYFLLNASYFYWDGGYSTGPRHVVASLPFACLALVSFWQAAHPRWRAVTFALGALSVALAFMCTSSGMFAPPIVPDEFGGFILPRFLEGRTTATIVRFFDWQFRYFLPVFVAFWALAFVIIGRRLRAVAPEGGQRDVVQTGDPLASGSPA